MSLISFTKVQGGGKIAVDADCIYVVEESLAEETAIHILDWSMPVLVNGSYEKIVALVSEGKTKAATPMFGSVLGKMI